MLIFLHGTEDRGGLTLRYTVGLVWSWALETVQLLQEIRSPLSAWIEKPKCLWLTVNSRCDLTGWSVPLRKSCVCSEPMPGSVWGPVKSTLWVCVWERDWEGWAGSVNVWQLCAWHPDNTPCDLLAHTHAHTHTNKTRESQRAWNSQADKNNQKGVEERVSWQWKTEMGERSRPPFLCPCWEIILCLICLSLCVLFSLVLFHSFFWTSHFESLPSVCFSIFISFLSVFYLSLWLWTIDFIMAWI